MSIRWTMVAASLAIALPPLATTAPPRAEDSAPWSPRGAPAVWVFDNKLFMAGGKYSVVENGTQRFIYRNDVWSMSRRR